MSCLACSKKLMNLIDCKINELEKSHESNLVIEEGGIPVNIGWTTPTQHQWKINYDATWVDSLHAGGINWVVRDWNEVF